jgi:hypothetical protein
MPPADVSVIADLRDPAILDNDGPVPVASERAEVRRIDQKPANSKRVGVRLHKKATPGKTLRGGRKSGEECPKKKDSGSARKEKQQIRETCSRPNRLNLFDLTAK